MWGRGKWISGIEFGKHSNTPDSYESILSGATVLTGMNLSG